MLGDVYPYLRPHQDVWTVESWQLYRNDTWIALPEVLEDWDPDTDLLVRANLQINRGLLAKQVGLPADVSLRLVSSWSSTSTQMTGVIARQEVEQGSMSLEALLPAERLGGTLILKLAVCLGTPQPDASPIAPGEAGAVLLEHETTITLQGDSEMFPVAVVDFAATAFETNSSWALEISTDLDAPFLGTFQLLINERDEDLVRAVTRGNQDRYERLLRDDLSEGVASALLETALRMREHLVEGDYAAGSVGSVLAERLAAAEAHGLSDAPSTPESAVDFTTRKVGVARALGHGRVIL